MKKDAELFAHLSEVDESLGDLSDGVWKETLIEVIQEWYRNTAAKQIDYTDAHDIWVSWLEATQ